MSIIVPDEGELLLIQYLVNKLTPDDPILHLFSNNPTVDEDIVIGDLTESTEAGYAPITLTGSSWTATQLSGITTAAFAEQTFTLTETATVYGYYISNNASDKLLWLQKFDGGPFVLPSIGGQIAFIPKITLD